MGFPYGYPWYDNPAVTKITYPSTTPHDQSRVTISTACPQHYVTIQYISLFRTSLCNRNIQDLLCIHILSLSIHFFQKIHSHSIKPVGARGRYKIPWVTSGFESSCQCRVNTVAEQLELPTTQHSLSSTLFFLFWFLRP